MAQKRTQAYGSGPTLSPRVEHRQDRGQPYRVTTEESCFSSYFRLLLWLMSEYYAQTEHERSSVGMGEEPVTPSFPVAWIGHSRTGM